ncbi:NUDIX domain-containing protein [Patescibacteria group bacterium]|nr:NUDIX domain-containing protein [Patescibacteria group bacterium]MBU0777050.1 NUDIX domain-containing protein [Patescibacteria group bacterium]MBU0845744.1 NUDIX domain-containing protein [Patescibacteria group bacterium]MBU0923206.1 NUDIX domain-containing protein [Patescibacteria group bacterium]MBU1066496.1 NUDIX domain-containing protein [Patescibacteria group bacterium]
MSEKLIQGIRDSVAEFYERRPVGKVDFDGQEENAIRFIRRLEQGNFTQAENPYNHFCVYFAAYDPKLKEVFIGHHKKSGLWLFNGGHIDEGESPQEALEREMGEEWGIEMTADEVGGSSLLTITDVENPGRQQCTLHYDIWYFVPVNKVEFEPDEELLSKEFYQTDWKSIADANELITDENTILAIREIVNRLEK